MWGVAERGGGVIGLSGAGVYRVRRLPSTGAARHGALASKEGCCAGEVVGHRRFARSRGFFDEKAGRNLPAAA